ncbi:nuclear transport factor 2 family protein [Mycobacterium sp.]|uniref:nuclear transport factor 2 family protein n=1 Tax=Mycobacterium sp. TaxID=1785 RepID=UPI003F98C5AA
MSDRADVAELVVRFADAVNRLDVQQFENVWAPEATWVIDPPTDSRLEGSPHDIATAFGVGMRAAWQSFIQVVHGTVVDVCGDAARARSYLTELGAPLNTEEGYFNHGVYEDELARTEAGWRFTRRHYRYLYLDSRPIHGLAAPLGAVL